MDMTDRTHNIRSLFTKNLTLQVFVQSCDTITENNRLLMNT